MYVIINKHQYIVINELQQENTMGYFEKTLDTELKYSGIIVNVRMDTAELCDGSKTKRGVLHHLAFCFADRKSVV